MKKKRKRWKWAIPLAATAVIVALGAAWMAFQHVPSWYRPVYVPADDYQRVRDSLQFACQEFSDGVINQESFRYTLTDRQINEWIYCRGEIWPDAEGVLPAFLAEPMIVFRPGEIILAGRYEGGEVQTVVNAGFTPTIEGDDLLIRLNSAGGGSLPVPRALISGPLAELLTSEQLWSRLQIEPGLDNDHLTQDRIAELIESTAKGWRVRNRFVWPNGKRPFRINGVSVEEHRLILDVVPL